MKKIYKVVIIGGGSAGLFAASMLSKKISDIAIIEKNSRLGRKLAVTGNGRGNITNTNINAEFYHGEKSFITGVLSKYTNKDLIQYLKELGALTVEENGRIYPMSMQAASVCDVLRYSLKSCDTFLNLLVTDIEKKAEVFNIMLSDGSKISTENIIFCTGGKAAKHLGTDGFSFSITKKLGHTTSPFFPSLVQLKTDTSSIKGLKGIKVNAKVAAVKDGRVLCETIGDLLFTDYGVSGNAIFELSAYVTDKNNCFLQINFLPSLTKDELKATLIIKLNQPYMVLEEFFSGILNKQLSKAILRTLSITSIASAKKNLDKIVDSVFNFSLKINGNSGFDSAQVTKGGILTSEIDQTMMSKICKCLYFAGEVMDVDGNCGGYNIQWAFSTAAIACENIVKKYLTE